MEDFGMSLMDHQTGVQKAVDGLPDTQRGKISDGYHTFDELYEHRIALYITLCRMVKTLVRLPIPVWKTKVHSDGSIWDGWFILGINTAAGYQITYHLPDSKWDECRFANILEKAPEFDGHTPADVLKRIKQLL